MNKQTETIDPQTGEVLDKAATTIGANNQIVPRDPPATVAPSLGKGAGAVAPPQAMPQTGFAKLADAISAITKEIAEDPIQKKGKNAFHNYSYARMQDILGGLAPLMGKHGITVMQAEVERGLLDNGNVIFATYDFTIIHKSGEVWPFPQRQTGTSKVRDSKGGYDDKGLNKCHTAARKYFLLSLFQIPTTDDEDADSHDSYGGRTRPVPPKKQAETSAPQEVERMAPYEIPRPSGISAAVWGGKYIEQIIQADGIDELDLWSHLNEKSLADLEKMAPKIHANVMKAVDNRIKWINTPQPTQST